MPIQNDIPGPEMTQFAVRILGNDYLPEAIVKFRRSLRFDPLDSIASEGLDIARSLVEYPSDNASKELLRPETEIFPQFLFGSEWFFLGIAAWLILCVLFVGLSASPIPKRIRVVVFVVLFLLACLPTLSEGVRYFRNRQDRLFPPVVVIKNTHLRSGNGLEYPPITTVPRGTECRVIVDKQRWIQVEFASGLVGWVPKSLTIAIP